mmetsp:Transcript_32386/g.58863  ORF Transcript_32386/g.58863 Transcript_32386/m.58863 type:complete len:231 (+) Transcript_32386:720-1412(+)
MAGNIGGVCRRLTFSSSCRHFRDQFESHGKLDWHCCLPSALALHAVHEHFGAAVDGSNHAAPASSSRSHDSLEHFCSWLPAHRCRLRNAGKELCADLHWVQPRRRHLVVQLCSSLHLYVILGEFVWQSQQHHRPGSSIKPILQRSSSCDAASSCMDSECMPPPRHGSCCCSAGSLWCQICAEAKNRLTHVARRGVSYVFLLLCHTFCSTTEWDHGMLCLHSIVQHDIITH